MSDENFARSDDFESALSDKVQETEEIQTLIFSSDGILYGVDADHVTEILNEVTVTRIPMVPEYVSGIINMRGQFVPIIDFRQLLGRAPSDDNCAIVLNIDGTSIGILVDDVDQMISISKSSVLPIPSQRANRMVSGMCTRPGSSNAVGNENTIMILDCTVLTRGNE